LFPDYYRLTTIYSEYCNGTVLGFIDICLVSQYIGKSRRAQRKNERDCLHLLRKDQEKCRGNTLQGQPFIAGKFLQYYVGKKTTISERAHYINTIDRDSDAGMNLANMDI